MITLRISFALSLITSYTLCNPQTLILFKIEKNKIFLAGDTKQVREEKIKTGNEFSIHREIDTVRKIGQANNVYYGIAGTFSGTTTSTVNIPAKYCTKNTSVEKIANNFGNAYSDSVKKFMINLKNFDPDEYEEKYLNSIGLVSAIFMKFENDSAKCVIVNFMITEKNGQLIVKPL